MAVSYDAEPKMTMDNIIQEAMVTGRSALSPTSPRDHRGGDFRDVTDSREYHPRMNVILDCLNTSSGERLSSRDRHCYVIPRSMGTTSYIYLAANDGGKK